MMALWRLRILAAVAVLAVAAGALHAEEAGGTVTRSRVAVDEEVSGTVSNSRDDAGHQPAEAPTVRAAGPGLLRAADGGLVRPVVEGRWLRPAVTDDGTPVPAWGHAEGLRVALWPAPGPRGLVRVYAPYLGNPQDHVINFIAVEPVVAGRRGFSELEVSGLDRTRGKRLWSADEASGAAPGQTPSPARGRIEREGDVETLTVFVFVEPFENGARPYLRLTFRSDRPEEVGLAAYAQPESARMDACILTATMGNYARLRRLHLKDRVATAGALWPDFRGNGFAPHARFPLEQLFRMPDGSAIVAAAPDEPNPADADYALFTPAWWKYRGAVATQYWRAPDPHSNLAAQVNGRTTYWGWHTAIPGGVAFENFELVAPFVAGQTFHFGVTRRTPESLVSGPAGAR